MARLLSHFGKSLSRVTLSAGTKLGRYEVRSKVGEGGMGAVYRATDEKLHRDVAIKVLPSDLSENTDRLHRFEQEAQAAGSLNHPNILAVYDVGVHENAPYVVSELLEGESFRELLSRGPLSGRKATDYATQIARGLAAAHDKNIIHRDLKPDNLFLTTDERVKILDFGLAKLSQSTGEQTQQTDIATRRVHTDPGTVMGTVGYMSPEQVRALPVDRRSDIFSFGTVLYEMLTGQRAFHRDSAIETLNAILKEEPAEIALSNPNIGPALERVVLHCLEKNPDRRFQSATDIVFALESLTGVSSLRSQETLIAAKGIPPARKSRERLIWAIISSVLLVSLMALAFAYFSRTPTNNRLVRLTLSVPDKGKFASNITLSPDGLMVTFVATDSSGRDQLWLRSLDSLKATPLAGTEGARTPFWSPDSKHIGYFANRKLIRIQISGGQPQTLCDVTENGGGGTWNRDGVILFGGSAGLFRVSAQGGTPVQATKEEPQEEAHRWPYFLPDGRHFVFLADAGTTENHNIRLGSLDSQQTQILFRAISRIVYASPGYLLYVNQSALVAVPFDASSLKVTGEPVTIAEQIADIGDNHDFDFSVSENGALAYQSGSFISQFTWFDRTGKKLETAGEPLGIANISLAPDDGSVAASVLDANGREGDVWIYNFKRSSSARLTFDPGGDGTPLWSPDGTRIVFGTTRRGTGAVDLYEKSASATGDEKLLYQSEAAKFATGWSRDSKYILFENWSPQSKGAIWLLDLTGTPKAEPLVKSSAFDVVQPVFSPDGKFISYTSNESGRNEIYVQRFPLTSDKWTISSTGGSESTWRKDSKELFFLSEENKLMSAEINSANGFESSIPRQLFDAGGLKRMTGTTYAPAGDGQRFLLCMSTDSDQSSALTIVLNWATILKQK